MKKVSTILLITQGYDRWSSFYDEYPNPTVASDEFHFPKIWKHLTGKHIIEIGCGTGRHTQKLLAQGNKVVGMDLSPGMLASARKKLSGNNIELIEGDFLNYKKFHQSEFDAAISSLVIEHVQDLSAFFQKLNRILKPGGVFFLSEIHHLRAKKGSLAHFREVGSEEELYLESYAHSDAKIRSAAHKSQFALKRSVDVYGDQALVKICPKWEKYLLQPMIKIFEFRLLTP